MWPIVTHFLERSTVYKLWQQPFVDQKLAPLQRRGEIERARRVLDVGCGPGTNTAAFARADYLGIDINQRYVAYATRRFGRRFIVGDVTQCSLASEGHFDFVFVNSMLHHIDDGGARRLLAHLASLVSPDGYLHLLDLVLPEHRFSVARALARLDRGDHPRPAGELQALVEESFDTVHVEPYRLTAAGHTLWDFVYIKARSRY
jgi:SAM-dependent methyltransferase